jgi:hypothetical protein
MKEKRRCKNFSSMVPELTNWQRSRHPQKSLSAEPLNPESIERARHFAQRLRDEILLPAVQALSDELNRRGAGRPWTCLANPASPGQGEFFARGLSLPAGLEIIISISGTAAGLELVVNVDRLRRQGRLSHAFHCFPVVDTEAAGDWALQEITAAAEIILHTIHDARKKHHV